MERCTISCASWHSCQHHDSRVCRNLALVAVFKLDMEYNHHAFTLVCMDPPYYNNVQYGELSDYFYVWQRRTLGDLYPGIFSVGW